VVRKNVPGIRCDLRRIGKIISDSNLERLINCTALKSHLRIRRSAHRFEQDSYHGDALPTELTGPVFTCLSWAFAIRPGTLRPPGRCTALMPHPGPASTPKLAGRASGTEHSAPRRYTSLAMGILRLAASARAGSRPVLPTQAPSGASPMAVALSGAIRGGAVLSSRSVDVQIDRYVLTAGIVDRVGRKSAYGGVT
jgi:hypothetical protein